MTEATSHSSNFTNALYYPTRREGGIFWGGILLAAGIYLSVFILPAVIAYGYLIRILGAAATDESELPAIRPFIGLIGTGIKAALIQAIYLAIPFGLFIGLTSGPLLEFLGRERAIQVTVTFLDPPVFIDITPPAMPYGLPIGISLAIITSLPFLYIGWISIGHYAQKSRHRANSDTDYVWCGRIREAFSFAVIRAVSETIKNATTRQKQIVGLIGGSVVILSGPIVFSVVTFGGVYLIRGISGILIWPILMIAPFPTFYTFAVGFHIFGEACGDIFSDGPTSSKNKWQSDREESTQEDTSRNNVDLFEKHQNKWHIPDSEKNDFAVEDPKGNYRYYKTERGAKNAIERWYEE